MAHEPTSAVTTIAALATAPGPAGLAVVRVSGPRAKETLEGLFRAKRSPADHRREMILGELLDGKSGAVIDRALAVYMPGPNSYTGEDIAEFQFHGSPLLAQRVLRSLYGFGLEPAEPGEFTKRAFLNGKLDLVQAEAVADLINASSEQALKIAGEHLKGRFSRAVTQIAEPLRDALAEIEANIDFPDEPITPVKTNRLAEVLGAARGAVHGLLHTYAFGQTVREGFRVLLCGRPNVGKSSLLNLLLGRPRAIVTEVSGTTRDLLEESASLAGFQFIFCDSAGIGESGNEAERIGIELAKERIPWADLVLFVVDASDPGGVHPEVLAHLRGKAKKIWMVVNKLDLNPGAISTHFCDSTTCAQNFYLSALTRNGFRELVDALTAEVKARIADSADASHVVTNERQRACLIRADGFLERALDVVKSSLPIEIVSVELRSTLTALDEVVGKTHSEDILGRIFSKFCIGK